MRFRPLVIPIFVLLAAPSTATADSAAGANRAAPTQGQMIVLGDELAALPLENRRTESIQHRKQQVGYGRVFGVNQVLTAVDATATATT